MQLLTKINSLITSIITIIMFVIIFGILLLTFDAFGIEMSAFNVSASQLSILACGLAFFNFNLQEVKKVFSAKINKDIITKVFVVSLAAIGINSLLKIIIGYIIDIQPIPETTVHTVTSAYVLNSFIMPMIVAPILEELTLRAGLKRSLVDKGGWGVKGYILISSILFGLLHYTPGSASGVHIMLTFLLGLLWSTVYVKTNNIYVSIFSHMIYNTFIITIAKITLG